MSQEICSAVLSTPALSASALGKLSAVAGVDWAHLWTLIQQYGGPLVIQVLEKVIPLLPIGASWQMLLQMILAELAKLVPTPTP